LNQLLSAQSNEEFSTYENSKWGIRMQYPSGWRIDDVSPPNSIVFHAPPSQRYIVSMTAFPADSTLEELASWGVGFFGQINPFEEAGPTTVAGNPAFEANFTAAPLKNSVIWTIISGKEYQFEYYGPEATYPTFRNMLNTFETIGTSPQMEVSILVGTSPTTPGSRQTITIDLFDSQSKQGVPGAIIDGTVTYAMQYAIKFYGETDSAGHLSHSWTIDRDTLPGTSTVKVTATSTNYMFPVTNSTNFEVT
jgi:hypothetical protein